MLLLIDTRDERPEPEHDDWRWLAAVLDWVFPWPAVLAWLFIGTIVVNGAAGAAFAIATLVVAFWRLSKIYPESGMTDYSQ